jgi:hypothetical protein
MFFLPCYFFFIGECPTASITIMKKDIWYGAPNF